MRGFFAIGIDGASKEGNIGNLIRTGHAFGASFAFAINPKIVRHSGKSVTADFADTSKTSTNIPFYEYESAHDIQLPKGALIVGIEISDDAIDLPSFRHPAQALYVLGSERNSLSAAMMERCDMIVKIPTKFSLNVATAGAIVMYDRMRSLGSFADRPVSARRRPDEKKAHVHGGPIYREHGSRKRVKDK